MIEMKKLISSIISIVILLSSSVNALAYSGSSSSSKSSIWDERNSKIVSIVKDTPSTDLNKKISDFFSEKSVYENDIKLFKEAVPQNSTETFVPTVYKNVKISPAKQISFYTDGSFAIITLDVSQPSNTTSFKTNSAINPFSTDAVYYSSGVLTKNYYGAVFGNLLYSIHDDGEFAYDGYNAWDNGSYSYYTFGDVSFGTVSQWSQGTFHFDGPNTEEVYGRGDFGCGFTILGQNFQLTDTWRELNLFCDPYGNLTYTAQWSNYGRRG